MTEENQAQNDYDMDPDAKVAKLYSEAQSAILLAGEAVKVLLQFVSKHRGLKAISAVTGMRHKLEKLVLETLKHASKVMEPMSEGDGK